MRWGWILVGLVVAAALGGLWYFNRIQWGPRGPMGALPVVVAPLEASTFNPHYTQSGRLSPKAEAEIRPAVAGIVSKIHFTEGQLVEAGDVLFTLDIRAYGAANQQAAAQFTQAKAAYERGQALRTQDAISQADLEARRAAYLAAAAGSRDAGVVGTSAVIKTPIAGRVGRAEATLGAVVGPQSGMPLTTVQQLDPLYVDFDIDEQTYLQLVERGQTSLRGIPVAVGLASDGTDFPLNATLTGLDNRLSEGTGTLSLRATLPNPSGTLISGLFARVKLSLPQPQTALLVNDAALGTDQTLRFLYKINASEQPERVVVTVGSMVNGLRAITSDALKAGDRVIVNGLMRIRPGMEVTPVPGDMRTLQPLAPPPPPAAAGAGA